MVKVRGKGGLLRILINSSHARIMLTVRNRTHKEAAEAMGISPEHFSRLMNGKCQPSPETRKALTTKIFVGVPWDKLFIMQTQTAGEI